MKIIRWEILNIIGESKPIYITEGIIECIQETIWYHSSVFMGGIYPQRPGMNAPPEIRYILPMA
jgi:hypothetical protein